MGGAGAFVPAAAPGVSNGGGGLKGQSGLQLPPQGARSNSKDETNSAGAYHSARAEASDIDYINVANNQRDSQRKVINTPTDNM